MEAAAEARVISAAPRGNVHPLTSADATEEEMKATAEEAGADTPTQHPNPKPNQVGTVMLYGIPIVSLVIDTQERLCLAQISNTLLRDFSYNEIHNRRVALGITCVQCTPVQLEILRRAGAMPVSSRRCGMITRREAERLCRSFLGDNTPPRLPDHFAFDVVHSCAWGCRGAFLPSRYNSSRAKCIRCSFCRSFFSPNKFIFHSHRLPDSEYVQPDAANFNSWRRHLSLAGNPAEEVTHAWEDVKAMFNGGTRKRMLSAAASSVSSSGEGSQGSRRTEQRQNKIAHHAPSPQDARPAPPPPPPPGAHLQGYLRPDKPRAEFPICRAQNPGPPVTELAPFVHLSPLPPPPPFPESALHPPPPPSIHYDLHRSFVDYVWSRQHCGQGGRGKAEAGFAPFSPYSLPWFKRPLLPFPPQNAPEAPHSPIVLPPPPPGALTERTPQDSRATPPSPALPHHHPGPLPVPFHPRSPAPASVISNLYASAFRPVGGASRRESEERREEEMREEDKRDEDEEETVDIETTEEEEEGWKGGGAGRDGVEGAEGMDGEEEDEEGGRSGEEGSGEQKSKDSKTGERCRLPLENSPPKSSPPALHPRPPPPLHRQWVPREADQQTERVLHGKASLATPHPMEHDRVYCHEMARQLHIIRELGVGTTAPSEHCPSPFFSEPLLAPASSIPLAEGNRRVVRLVAVHDRLKDAHSTLHQLSNKMALDCSTGCHVYPETKLTQ